MGLFHTITKCLMMLNMFIYGVLSLKFRQLRRLHESQTRSFEYLNTAYLISKNKLLRYKNIKYNISLSRNRTTLMLDELNAYENECV